MTRFDRSTYYLLAANVVNGLLALWQHWNLATLLWVYWFQSVTIGVFACASMFLIARRQRAQVRPLPGQTELPVWGGLLASLFLYGLPVFFAVHYGFFHLGYVIFLAAFFSGAAWASILLGAALFFLNSFYTFLEERSTIASENIVKNFLNFWQQMTRPYARIIPMHLTIMVFGFLTFNNIVTGQLPLAVFLILKTVADLKMHVHEKSLNGVNPLGAVLLPPS